MNAENLIAIVGSGAILPDAFDVPSFWQNIQNGKVSIREVPAGRWDPALYYDPDPSAPDKTYTKIGAFVENYAFNPFDLGLVIPPRLLETLDPVQQWAIAAAHQALSAFGWPQKPINGERTAVILGNSNAGEGHYNSTFRLRLPQYQQYLQQQPAFQALPAGLQNQLLEGIRSGVWADIPAITEDTMPGELSNIIAGRVANVFNLSGPNFTTDAACASSLAAINAACLGLRARQFDLVLTGGIDRSNGPESYIKFSKIGALSPDGSRPYAAGANGFVMGEGAVVFLLKRLEDAERDGDKVYAVIHGIGASSDGKGKGITAPNPAGQQKAIERAWQAAAIDPAQAGYIEGHGTSTRVGDLAEVNSLQGIFEPLGLKSGSIVLGSIKANIGHLKSAAGAAGLLKAIFALHEQLLPETPGFEQPNSAIPFGQIPFRVLRGSQGWESKPDRPRFAGVSAFGFGGTNFHVVLSEYLPGLAGNQGNQFGVPALKIAAAAANQGLQTAPSTPQALTTTQPQPHKAPADAEDVKTYVLEQVSEKTGYPAQMLDLDLDLEADLGVDTVKQAELFAGLRQHYGIPRDEKLVLAEYNTLAKVIAFVQGAMPAQEAATAQTAPSSPHPTQTVGQMPSAQGLASQEAQPLTQPPSAPSAPAAAPSAYQGLYFASSSTAAGLKHQLQQALQAPIGLATALPSPEERSLPERIAIDYAAPEELPKKLERALAALESESPAAWKALQAHGIYRGSGQPGKLAFLFPGQGSQYVNMLKDLFDDEPLVRETFDEADAAMAPILGRPLTSFIYADGDEEALKAAEAELKKTVVTQPAMLAADVAIMRVMQKYGLQPDFLMGHSLGEYAALVGAGVLSFPDALQIVSARGREMTRIKTDDPGAMAAVSAPIEKVKALLKEIPGYIVIANINSPVQCVLGGETAAIEAALQKFKDAGFQAVRIPVSHAFHTRIVAPASDHLRTEIANRAVNAPRVPIVANVNGNIYPHGREAILDLLAAQVASPVQFVRGMQTLYQEGARVFIECGPKRVLSALAADNLKPYPDVIVIPTNHPRKGGKASFNEALCAMLAAGLPQAGHESGSEKKAVIDLLPDETAHRLSFVEAVDAQGCSPITGSVVVSGAGLGLPGKDHHVFEDGNVAAILSGEMRIEALSEALKQDILEKRITRLVKSQAGAVMETLHASEEALQYAGQRGKFDLVQDYGLPADRVEALDISSQLAIAAGIEALRDARIPLVMSYKHTSLGSRLPDRWKLPESLQDETGVIFGSAFPGVNRLLEEQERYLEASLHRNALADLDATLDLVRSLGLKDAAPLLTALQERRTHLAANAEEKAYGFDRRFLFRILSMGHSQFADYIGARGPNAHVNAACATTTHAISVAEDWIRSGRCRRVIVIAGDDVTNPQSMDWVGSSLLASGAASNQADLRLAAIPFDRRRNGMIMGMGAVGIVLESEDAIRERGMHGIAELLSSYTANSAFHGTRLDLKHVSQGMDTLLQTAERRFGLARAQIAPFTLFVSHETYTPARGGSASAEIHALRHTFGAKADEVLIANTKGFTGHTMGVGIEDVLAIKALETGLVPPIANYDADFEPDPDLGSLKLSQGGRYDPQFALRLGAGFGSQIAFTLMRRLAGAEARVDAPRYQDWLDGVTGYAQAQTELVSRTLRVPDQGAPQRQPAACTWTYGQVPRLWAQAERSADTILVNQPAVLDQAAPPAEAPAAEPQVQDPSSQMPPEQDAPSPLQAQITQRLLGMVAEKTGYPPEMLDLELDLEADLGIDTVKQAELFAEIRSHYGIPRQENLVLADYNTLAKVVQFIQSNLPAAETADLAEPASEALDASPKPARVSEPLAPVPAPAPASAEQLPQNDLAAIQAFLLDSVSEKTGYPKEMLDLDLDLEADLGIDTVKQAELFAAVREHFAIPRQENLVLADYNTLAKVIGFVQQGLAAQAPAQAVELPAQAAPAVQEAMPEKAGKQPSAPPVEGQTLIPRQPVAVLIPKAELYLPALAGLAGKRIGILGGSSAQKQALSKLLTQNTAQAIALELKDLPETASGLDGLYCLLGLKPAPQETPAWEDWTQTLLHALHALATQLPTSAFILAATAMGGMHGLQDPVNADAGLISGFFKALRRERPQQLVKVIDFEPSLRPSQIAQALILETLHDSSNTEIAYSQGLRYTLDLQAQAAAAQAAQPLPQDLVCLVTGGTAGIVAPIVQDLAAHAPGTYYLLGRKPLLAADDPRLALLENDLEGLKTQLAEAMQSQGEKVTPVAIEAQLLNLQKSAGMHRLLAQLEQAGARAFYLPCDLQDPASLDAVLDKVKNESGRLDLLIHAAGAEKSRKIENKPFEEFCAVVQAKVHGLQSLRAALKAKQLLPMRYVFFSSVAGRFGNAGQTDYAAANDWLSKQAFALSADGQTQALAIDWSAWGELGMATRGSIPRVMRLAGVELLQPAAAAPLVRQLLEAGCSGEWLVAAGMGKLMPEAQADGVDLALADAKLRQENAMHTMLSHISAFTPSGGLKLVAELDPSQEAFLHDHAINGIPVLPGVVGIDGFVRAARHIAGTLASDKGFEVQRVDKVEFLAPVKFYRNAPRKIEWTARGFASPAGIRVEATLESDWLRANGATDHILHFTGSLYLTEKAAEPLHSPASLSWNKGRIIPAEDIYKLYFHGPAFQVLDGVQVDQNGLLGKFNRKLGHDLPSDETPYHLLMELCFQTAGLFEIGKRSTLSLPRAVESIRLYKQPLNGVPVYALVTPREDANGLSFDATVLDKDGKVFLEMENYQTASLPYNLEPELLAPIQSHF